MSSLMVYDRKFKMVIKRGAGYRLPVSCGCVKSGGMRHRQFGLLGCGSLLRPKTAPALIQVKRELQLVVDALHRFGSVAYRTFPQQCEQKYACPFHFS
jgi:hypothetical protein